MRNTTSSIPVRLMERVLRNRRLRWAVLLAGLFLAGLLFFTRGPGLPETELPQAESESSEGELDEQADLSDEALTLPFYPTFETVLTLTDRHALEEYLYSIDETAYVYDSDLPMETLLEMDFSAPLAGAGDAPKILIFHTHSQETFIDSRPGEQDDTIVGVGSELARILAEEYGITVVHDVGQYDVLNGAEYRDGSYERMEPAIQGLLAKYPSIEATIDLHRDGVPDGVRLLTILDGKPTARIMFFNGISRLNQRGEPVEVPSLPNPHIAWNLGLSLQLQLTANELYPGFARKIYIRPYRYSLHFMPKSMLVEVGANTSTVAEAKNAMYPLAEILVRVLGEEPHEENMTDQN